MTVVGAAIGGIALLGAGVAIATTGETPDARTSSGVEQPAPTESGPSQGAAPTDDPTSATSAAGAEPTAKDAVSPEQAIEIAEQALAAEGAVPPFREVERDHEHGRSVWEVEFGSDHEVYVDSETGEVVKIERDDGHDDRDDDHWDDDDHDDDHDDDDRDDDDRDDDDWDD